MVRLFASAAVVVGPHGSGLASAAFCQDSSVLVEFGAPRTSSLIFYAHLSAALDLRYAYVEAAPAKAGDTASGLRGALFVNVSHTLTVISRLLTDAAEGT